MKIREFCRLALRLRMPLPSGTASLIGWRRPFSPSAELSRTLRGQVSMKKSTSQSNSSEPMGIVITTGVRAPIEPLVRAYVWGEATPQPADLSHTEKKLVI